MNELDILANCYKASAYPSIQLLFRWVPCFIPYAKPIVVVCGLPACPL